MITIHVHVIEISAKSWSFGIGMNFGPIDSMGILVNLAGSESALSMSI